MEEGGREEWAAGMQFREANLSEAETGAAPM